MAAQGQGDRGPLRDGLPREAVDPARERRVEGEDDPGRGQGEEAHPEEAPEVEARAVQEAAHRPAAGGRAEDAEEAAGQEDLQQQVERAQAEDRRVERAAAPSREEAGGQGALQQQLEVPEGEAGAEDVRREGRRRALLALGPLRPPVVVEAVHHPARRAPVGEVPLELQGEGNREDESEGEVAEEHEEDEAPVAAHGAEAGAKSGQHGLTPPPRGAPGGSGARRDSARPTSWRPVARAAASEIHSLLEGSTSIAIFRPGSTTARTTLAPSYRKRTQRSRPSHLSVTVRPSARSTRSSTGRTHLAVTHDRDARLEALVAVALSLPVRLARAPSGRAGRPFPRASRPACAPARSSPRPRSRTGSPRRRSRRRTTASPAP